MAEIWQPIPHLPTEIVLMIQSFLPLNALIKARGVCRFWRSIIPGSHILPARRALLEFYLRAIRSPAFLATRPRIQAHLKPFDRERLLARLPPSVPEEFRTWVLEWPARAAVGHIWPGLHNMAHRKDTPPALLLLRLASSTHGTQRLCGTGEYGTTRASKTKWILNCSRVFARSA